MWTLDVKPGECTLTSPDGRKETYSSQKMFYPKIHYALNACKFFGINIKVNWSN